MELKIIPVGRFQCNCVILSDPVTHDALVIDPGDDVPAILAWIRKQGLKVSTIVHTHTHIDHIGATGALQKETNARVLLHEADLFLYEKMAEQAAFLRMPLTSDIRVPPDAYLKDGQSLNVGSFQGTVLHTPGHTPGSCGFYFPENAEAGILFPGDTLFAGSIGRTDLWKGDYDQEIASIKKKYLTLPEETVVVPGHGPQTTIGFESRNNPFLQ